MYDQKYRLVLLCQDCLTSRVLYHFLKDKVFIELVIIEKPVSVLKKIKTKLKIIGLRKTLGQVLFISMVIPFLKILSKKRLKELKDKHHFNFNPIHSSNIVHVESVNSKQCIDVLTTTKPDIVLVNGTRIISKKVLDSVKTAFINIHTGITPKYRGVHGGYWALVNRDYDHFGTTVHCIDSGIDTGDILLQVRGMPSYQDNFYTYPLIQYEMILEHLPKLFHDIYEKKISSIKPNHLNSKQWYHPTLVEYIFNFILKRVY